MEKTSADIWADTTIVIPPPGAKTIAHMGGALIDVDPGRPLPSGTGAWSWHGRKGWLPPHAWPHGVYEPGEHEAIRLEEKARKAAAAAVRFSVADQVGKNGLPDVPEHVKAMRRTPGLPIMEAGLPPGWGETEPPV